MARDNLYKIALVRSSLTTEEYEVYKLDMDFFHISTYHVSRRETGATGDQGARVFFACDCLAGHRRVCRHRTMVKTWLSSPSNRDKAYDFDRDEFSELSGESRPEGSL